MRFWIFSDLHLEVQKISLPSVAPTGVDAILCAGDLCQSHQLAYWAEKIISKYNLPLILVPGNHEFFEGQAENARPLRHKRISMQKLVEASNSWRQRLHVIDDSSVVVGDVQILGGTLWTDFKLDTASDRDVAWRMNDAISMVPDYSSIYSSAGRKLTPQGVLKMHRKTRAFIHETLERSTTSKRLVISHHLPHPACTPQAYAGQKSNFLYASSSEAFGELLNSANAPAYWICGHTHQKVDVKIGNTHVVGNPKGYQVDSHERENGFRWDFVIEV